MPVNDQTHDKSIKSPITCTGFNRLCWDQWWGAWCWNSFIFERRGTAGQTGRMDRLGKWSSTQTMSFIPVGVSPEVRTDRAAPSIPCFSIRSHREIDRVRTSVLALICPLSTAQKYSRLAKTHGFRIYGRNPKQCLAFVLAIDESGGNRGRVSKYVTVPLAISDKVL